MPYIIVLLGIYMLTVAMHGNGLALIKQVEKDGEKAGIWLLGWIVLLVMAKTWRPFYYLAILALIVYVLNEHESIFSNISEIWNRIEGDSNG